MHDGVIVVHGGHGFVFERPAGHHLGRLILTPSSDVLGSVRQRFLGFALQAILLLIDTVVALAHLFKVHDGGQVAARAAAPKVKRHLAEFVVIFP